MSNVVPHRVEDALQSMQEMAASKSWRNLFKLTEAVKPDPKTEAFFAVRRFRVLSLVKLRLFKNAADDLVGLELGNAMVPFDLRLLNALVPSLNGNHALSLDLLYGLLDWLAAHPQDKADVKYCQTQLSLVSVLARQKDVLCAIELLEQMLGKERSDAALLSLLGQLCLELGDVARAAAVFASAAPLLSSPGASDNDRLLGSMSAGLLHFAQSEYDKAMECFERVMQATESAYAVAATNNMAVCLLFTRNLSGAVALLEQQLAVKPAQFLEEVFVSNLCTLLDLYSEKPAEKKAEIAKLAAMHGDSFDASLIS